MNNFKMLSVGGEVTEDKDSQVDKNFESQIEPNSICESLLTYFIGE